MFNEYKLLILKGLVYTLGLLYMPTNSHAQITTDAPKNFLGQSQASYDDLTNILIESKLTADIIVKKVKKLPPSQSIRVPNNKKRVLITAEVQSLIRGKNGLNREIKFLYDAPTDSRGKIPKLKKQRFLAFGDNIPNRSDYIKLTHAGSILPYNNDQDMMIRNIITGILAENAAQKIISVTSAFHSPGTIIGEGETQVFLSTEFNQPMAISVINRAGERKRWSVSTSEVIDINATEPKRNSLLGYRLACDLPNIIAQDKIEAADIESKRKAAMDYDFIKKAIGPCIRNIDWE